MPARPSQRRPLAGSARAAHGVAIIVALSVLLGHVQRQFSTPLRNFELGTRSRNSFLFFRECFGHKPGCLCSCLDPMTFSGAWCNERASHGHRGSAEGQRARAGPRVPDALADSARRGISAACALGSRTRQRVPMNLDHLRSDQVRSDQRYGRAT